MELKNKERYNLALHFRIKDPRAKMKKAIRSGSFSCSFSTNFLTKLLIMIDHNTAGDLATWDRAVGAHRIGVKGLQYGSLV
jgi:hypothetical protein